ncbi:MAG: 30S ribosome-binding factor RbfA [Paracoccaceae bacterium]
MASNRFPKGSRPSHRQLRVGEAIRRTLSDVLARGEVHNDELSRMSITVGEVRVSPDLRVATAYVLPLGGKAGDEALAALNRSKGELRHHVASAMTLKFAPELRFVLDETFDRMDATRRLLAEDRVQRDIAAREDDADGDLD